MNRFPDGKSFAFTVFDDTDRSTVENIQPVYRLLAELGIRTTKSVWPLPETSGGRIDGSTLEDKRYLDFIISLQNEGFEIGLHNVRNHDATREMVERGLEQFYKLLGRYPGTHCNHDTNRENLYWGAGRFGVPTIRMVYNLATRFRHANYFEGHIENSPYFWGDICQQRINYVRNFVFDEINLDRINPTLPYHDASKPFVNLWFSSTDGGTAERFCKILNEANQDKLEAEGGVCIMYTHFAAGFCRNGSLQPEFERLMRRLAKKNGWFVPVALLLDHLHKSRTTSCIPDQELARMERVWLFSKIRKGTS